MANNQYSGLFESPFKDTDYYQYMHDPRFGNIPSKYISPYDRVSVMGLGNNSQYDKNGFKTQYNNQQRVSDNGFKREQIEGMKSNGNGSSHLGFKNEIYTPNDIRRSKYNSTNSMYNSPGDYYNTYLESQLFADTNMEGIGSNHDNVGKSYNWYGDVTYNPQVQTSTPERCEARNMNCAKLPDDQQWQCINYVRRTGCDYYIPGSVPVPSVGRWGGVPYNQEAAQQNRAQRWRMATEPRIVNGLPANPIPRPASLMQPEQMTASNYGLSLAYPSEVYEKKEKMNSKIRRETINPKIRRETMILGDNSNMTPRCNGMSQDCVRPKFRQ